MWGAAACGPNSAKTASTSPTAPAVTRNPLVLAPNDCVAPPPPGGTKAHSAVLGFTVTLPAGWAENPSNEGQSGLMAAFDLESGSGRTGASISADPWPSAMSPHDAVNWTASQPGAGSVGAKGDCTIAGRKAAFFESTVQFSVFVGITYKFGGYTLFIAHGAKLVYVLIDFPSETRDSFMPQIKSILGSWQWDA